MQEEVHKNGNRTALSDYSAFIEKCDGKMTLDHTYSNEALIKRIDATEEVAKKVDFDAKINLEKACIHAGKIIDTLKLIIIRSYLKGTDEITSELQNLQAAKFPELKAESDKAKVSCRAINVKELTLNKKDKIKEFFCDTSDLLKKMNS